MRLRSFGVRSHRLEWLASTTLRNLCGSGREAVLNPKFSRLLTRQDIQPLFPELFNLEPGHDVEPATLLQAEILTRCGLEPSDFDKRTAQVLINLVRRRRIASLASIKQVFLLNKLGYAKAKNVDLDEAGRIIQGLRLERDLKHNQLRRPRA